MWRRKRKPSPEALEAQQRLAAAQEELEAALADGPTVERVTRHVRELRRKNHFGPMVAQAIRGSR